MKIQLTKSQITDLFEALGKNEKQDTEIYADLKHIIRLHPRMAMSTVFDVELSDAEAKIVRELLTPPEREVSGDRIFLEMKKGMKKQY
jgi:hypothetical protein